jgi:hypothetical protein
MKKHNMILSHELDKIPARFHEPLAALEQTKQQPLLVVLLT